MNYFIIELAAVAILEPSNLESWAVCLPYCAIADSKTHCHNFFLLFILVLVEVDVHEHLSLIRIMI